MIPVNILVRPYDVSTSARVDVRAADAGSAGAFGLGGQSWKPAVTSRPILSLELMSPNLDGRVQAGKCGFELSLTALGLSNTSVLKWKGAPVEVYLATELSLGVPDFVGIVVDDSQDLSSGTLRLSCEVSDEFLNRPLLTSEFTGGGGATGDASKRGVLKPAGFGAVNNIEPVWFDPTNWVGMIDGYANCTAITALKEGLNSLGASFGNYANYAALVAAAIPPGRWGTCLVEGLVRLGAPPVKPITVDATFGSNRIGAIMQRMLTTHAGISGTLVDAAAFNAVDTALPYNAHYWTADQRDIKDLLEAMAGSVNATPLVSFQGKVTITRAVTTAAIATLDRSGKQIPRVTDWKSAGTLTPVWRIKARVARPARVLTFDEVNYVDDIIDRGLYSNATVYRAGNVVYTSDGASWLYLNAIAASGNAPPTLPTTSNAYWQNLLPGLLGYEGDPNATRNVPGQMIQDANFLATYWTLDGTVPFALVDAASGTALSIPYVDNAAARYATYGGTGNYRFSVEPGRKLFIRFVADPEATSGGVANILDGADSLFDGADRLVDEAVAVKATWDLVAVINFYSSTGSLISQPVVATVLPAGGRQVVNGEVTVPPAAFRATILLGYPTQAGKAGSWAVWDPWIAEHQPAADITADNAPLLTLPENQTIACFANGVPKTGQLPRTVFPIRRRGQVNVTQLSTWSANSSGCGGSIDDNPANVDRGALTIFSMDAVNAYAIIFSNLDGVEMSGRVNFTKLLDLPETPVAITGISVTPTSVNRSISTDINSDTYGFASAAAVVAVPASGVIETLSVLEYSALYSSGGVNIAGKWRYRVSGPGAWTDMGAEIVGSRAISRISGNVYEPETYEVPGSVSVNQSVSGLAAGNYDVELLLRRQYGTASTPVVGSSTIQTRV